MAKAVDYKLGPSTFPRGWFIVAESKELDAGPMAVHYFGQDFALFRGESGRPIMLDAYCAHMGTHLTAGTSAMIVQNHRQIEGDAIRWHFEEHFQKPFWQDDPIALVPHDGRSAIFESEVLSRIRAGLRNGCPVGSCRTCEARRDALFRPLPQSEGGLAVLR